MIEERVQTLDIGTYLLDPAIPVTITEAGPGADFPLHSHSFCELVLIRKGRGTHLFDDEALPLRAGDVFLIRGDRTHGYRDSADMVLTNILFDRAVSIPDESDLRTLPGYHALFMIEPHYRRSDRFQSCLHLEYEQLRQVERWIEELKGELRERAAGARTVCLAILSRMLVFLCRAYEGNRHALSSKLLRLAETVSWMETHAVEAVDISTLCDMAHMARSTFHRIFGEVYGVAPLEYLLQLRVRRAAAMLRDTALPVTEVGLACGFSDSNYFARLFRKQMGLSPSAYRKYVLR